MQEVRLQFSKEGRAVYISHLDIVRCFARAMGRAGVPVYYTQGFNPQPYLVFSPPLSLGYTGLAELCDFSVEDDALPVEQIAAMLAKTMPEGIRPRASAAPVHKLGLLQKADYVVELVGEGTASFAQQAIDCLSRPEIVVLKKSKRRQAETNIAPLIERLQVQPEEDGRLSLSCRLAVAGEGALNPRYLVEVLQRDLPQLAFTDCFVTRTGFYLENDEPFC